MRDYALAITYISAFLVLFVPLMVNESLYFPYIVGKNVAFRVLVEVALVGWAILALLDKDYRPRFSWMAVGGAALLVIMFFANLFGEYPVKSFWSNFERMEGYITLVHFFLYFWVLGHILRTPQMWRNFLHTTVGVATYVALYGLAQSTGMIEGRDRVDSTLGNAAYMAIYMLFHIFFVFYLSLQARTWLLRSLYIILVVLFAYILLETGTRGTFLGLLSGGFVSVAYMTLFSGRYPEARKVAVGGLIALVAVVGIFYTFRDSEAIQSNRAMARIANIDLGRDLETRTTIWGMAYEGFQERPLLGWGQGNFNYVFNMEYEPSLYAQEQWFDRVHNIFFDWLIAGGILGFVAYFSIIIGALYYLFWQPLFRREDEAERDEHSFNVLERAVLLGILAGYFTHNIVVFDNIVSYVFYAVVLGLIHARVATPITYFEKLSVPKDVVTKIAAPVAVATIAVMVYFVHYPAIATGQSIITAFRTQTVEDRQAALETALSYDSFARQEVVEQLAQQAMSLARQQGIPEEQKTEFITLAESELQQLVEDKPGDARLHIFFASFYRAIGDLDKAAEQLALSRQFTPNKQAVILEQGVVALLQGDHEASVEFLREAHELDESFETARTFYAAALLYTDEPERWSDVIEEEHFKDFSLDNFAMQAAELNGQSDLLIRMLGQRIMAEPENRQYRASLAFVYYREGRVEEAIAVLEEAVEVIPAFSNTGTCFIENLEAGNQPDEGC